MRRPMIVVFTLALAGGAASLGCGDSKSLPGVDGGAGTSGAKGGASGAAGGKSGTAGSAAGAVGGASGSAGSASNGGAAGA
jgi:hypothetical protein